MRKILSMMLLLAMAVTVTGKGPKYTASDLSYTSSAQIQC